MLSEDAKDVPGFEGVYAATKDGRVYSHSRVVKASHGKTQLRKGRWLKPKINNGRVLFNIGAKWKLAHRIIAMTFLPNPNCKPQVNHIDGNPLNNNVDNLEWCTQSENIKHAYATGLKKPIRFLGTNHPSHKLTDEEVLEIKKSTESLSAISERYGISKTWASKIRRGINWAHVEAKSHDYTETSVNEGDRKR